jgi:glycosyltransferase involved in cell wall biosynthesis
MTAERVSVVIPVFDGARFLAEAIESALGQTAPASELIVVDDGSSDGSGEIARAYERVTVLQLAHQGVSAARNAGVAAATGTHLAFLDADDVWALEKLERQIALSRTDPSAGVIMARLTYRFEGPIPAWFRGPTGGGSEAGYLPSCWFMPRSTWDHVGPFDASMTHSEDTDWLARVNDAGIRTAMVDEILVTHRIHDRNASGMPEAVRGGILTALRASLHRKHESEE